MFSKTGRPFSSLALDQAHEQNNAVLKDGGGVVGLTNDPDALRRVMIAGPEVTRLLKEFQARLYLSNFVKNMRFYSQVEL